VRRAATLAVGIVGGTIVGMTSVGSGSLIIVALLLVYPGLSAGQLVGTDLVQAIPLVGAAALGHAIFGDVHLPVTLSLLLGAIPAVYVGARLSATGANRLVRPVLAVVLLASALKLVNVSTDWTLVASGAWIAANLAVSALRRRRASAGDIPASDALAGQFS